MKKILFTGGGSAGHVVPNMAIMDALKDKYELYYMGTDGIEKKLISAWKIPYAQIECPKFIRGFSVSNLDIPRKLFYSIKEAKKKINMIEPDLVFSKGGYVSLPVAFAAAQKKIPVLTHESDLSIGLANRLIALKSKYTLTSFPKTAEKVKNGRYTGSPVRKNLNKIDKQEARKLYGFYENKPVILFLGGGSGSVTLNNAIRKDLSLLCKKYYVLHLCGKGNILQTNIGGYLQKEYEKDMASAYASADLVVARAGSNTVFEILTLKKPSILVPLSNSRSRGDQVENAEYFLSKGLCSIVYEEDLNTLSCKIEEVLYDEKIKTALDMADIPDGVANIVKVIDEILEKN